MFETNNNEVAKMTESKEMDVFEASARFAKPDAFEVFAEFNRSKDFSNKRHVFPHNPFAKPDAFEVFAELGRSKS